MKNILLLCCLIFVAGTYNARAQFIYPNDICSGAKPLPISNIGQLSDSAFQSHTFADPAASTIPNCSGNSYPKNDLWYSFIATDTSLAVVLEQLPTGGFYQLFSGNCDGLTSMQCNAASNVFPDLTGLVPGQKYYLRTYGMQDGHKLSLLGRPINDDCSGAALVAVNAVDEPVADAMRFSNALSTVSSNNDCAPIGQFSGHKDVWYKFVATSTAHTVYMLTAMNKTKAQVYGGTPGSFTSLGYHNFGTGSTAIMPLNNLSIGNKYYIRVGAPTVVNFKMAILQGSAPNDECVNADTVSISSSFKCENSFAVNRIKATKSIMPCFNSAERDVWYIFKATSPDITVSSSGDGAFALRLGLLGGSCGALTCLADISGSSFNYNGLTVGNYYYLVAGGASGSEQTAYICIAPQITNDECSGAISLAVKPYNVLRTNIGYNKGATQSMPSCKNKNNISDVWYRFTATDTACLITIDAANASYPYFQVFSGDCNNLNSIHCSSSQMLPDNANERTERVGGLLAGNNYYLRFYTDDYSAGNFTIDINSLPPNDTCTGAIELIPQQDLSYEPITNNGILQATTSLPACVAMPVTKDIWYKFTATHSSMAIITNREYGSDFDLSYLGLEIYSGSCGSLTSMACLQQGNPFSLHKARTFTDLVPGQTYYIRQYGNVANNKITIIKPPVNDEMSGAIKLAPSAANVQTMPSYYLHGASKKFGKICSNGNYAINHDVWFYFIATQASHTVSTNDNNTYWDKDQGFYYYRLETFRGYASDSTSLVPKAINCGQGSVTVNGLSAGDTVYVRITNMAAQGNTSIFSVKVSNTQNMDEPAGALVLDKLNSYQYAVNTAGATQSLAATGCTMPDFPDDDIWFKFTASAVTKRIVAGYETRDITLQLFSGTTGNLTALKCSNNIMLLPDGLINGTDYFVRAYSKANALSSEFKIGLFGEDDPLANNCISSNELGPNLVLNPRCESEYPYLLPKNVTGGNALVLNRKMAEGWTSASFATPDIWNADYPYGQWGNLPGNVGNSRDKIPRSGKGALGILTSNNWSEYVSGQLKEPLVKGKYYLVSFYVSANKGAAKDALNIGALLSNNPVLSYSSDAQAIVPHIANTIENPVIAENSWRNICGIVYADKPYTFITIGNFGDRLIYSGGYGSYYFIDDVVVAEVTNQVLPLNLLNFNGRTNTQQQTELNWQTANEENTKTFEVQWRTEVNPFIKIGSVDAKEMSFNAYNFLHLNPEQGYNYYRLKMYDIDGKFTYSSIIKTGLKSSNNGISVFPNPVSTSVNISVKADKDENVFFRLIHSNGSTVATKSIMLKKGSNAFTWDVKQLAAGSYFITSTNKNFKVVKLVKQ